MDELLEFIDETFINLSGNICSAHAVNMEDLKRLELLTKEAIKSKEN
jgi:hypothetical protein